MTPVTFQLEGVLNSAQEGLRLAETVAVQLRDRRTVALDFASVDRATPSFANAFVMTLLGEFTPDYLRERCLMLNCAPHVGAQFAKSVQRYRDGIRLSNQAPARSA